MINLDRKKWGLYLLRPLGTLPIYLYNMLLAMALFMVSRLVFVAVNIDYYPGLTASSLWPLLQAGLIFDASAVAYTNLLVTLLVLLPLHLKERPWCHRLSRAIFVLLNTICMAVNLIDTVYFAYSNRRSTFAVFSQFGGEEHLPSIFAREMLAHWYLVLLVVLSAYALWRLYRDPHPRVAEHKLGYYLVYTLLCLGGAVANVGAMRGGLSHAVRPITISNANQYVTRPVETAIVLNTPFAMYRTLSKKPFVVPAYFSSEAEMAAYYSPLHTPRLITDSVPARGAGKNVVILILESFGSEYWGIYNKHLKKSYTPFLDSLAQQGLYYLDSFANGHTSIDGMPSVLSSIPKVQEPFFLTPASLNELTSVAGLLRDRWGYHTSFFHGAYNGSMGFMAYAKAVGFEEYHGRTEYANDADFDGTWAIWDEEFMQYWAEQLKGMPCPFCSSIFTASSHHPFKIPARYEGKFDEGTLPIHKTIGYSDHAVRRFFEAIRDEEWYDDTIFVITADHTNASAYDEYKSEVGTYRVPIIFYTPDGDLRGEGAGIAQQIDIMPTLLGYLGYDRPFVAFGRDLLHTPSSETFAFADLSGGNLYQMIQGEYAVQYDGTKVTGVYAYKSDPLLRHNLVGQVDISQTELRLKALLQQYMQRMVDNQLVVR